MKLTKFLDNVKKRVFKHWQNTVKGLIYGTLTYMLYKGEITVVDWIAGTGSILTFNSIFLQKDSDKVANKPDQDEV